MDLSQELKTLRIKSGLTQNEVATFLNVSRQTISNWEHGRSNPDIDNLSLLSSLYGFDIQKLVKNNLSFKEKLHLKKQQILSLFHKYDSNKFRGYSLIIMSGMSFLLFPIFSILPFVVLWLNIKNNTFHKLIIVLSIISIIYNVFTGYEIICDLFGFGITTSVTS